MTSEQVAEPRTADAQPAADPEETGPLGRARRYALSRTVVVPDLKVLYLPVPKAGCTSMLWLLADLAGLERERFFRSTTREVTLPMTVHDLWVWGREGLRLTDLTDDDRAAALTGDDWFRFTIVREPASRLWSAWQSKLLMREPRFVETFGHEPWFPALPTESEPERVLADFRAFVVALAERWDEEFVRDPHWTPQSDIVDGLPLDHVGRLEDLDATMAALRAHVGDRPELDRPLPRENRTPIAYDPVVYDSVAAQALASMYAADFEPFGYPAVGGTDDDEAAVAAWCDRAVRAFSAVHEVALRHERLNALATVVYDRTQEVRSLKDDVAARKATIRDLEKQAKADAKTIADRDAKLASVTEQRDTLTRERNDARGELSRVYASTSWKMTKPFRWFTGLFKRRRTPE